MVRCLAVATGTEIWMRPIGTRNLEPRRAGPGRMTDNPLARWEALTGELRATDHLIARKRDMRLMLALSNPTAWELRSLRSRREELESERRGLARELGVTLFPSRQTAAA